MGPFRESQQWNMVLDISTHSDYVFHYAEEEEYEDEGEEGV